MLLTNFPMIYSAGDNMYVSAVEVKSCTCRLYTIVSNNRSYYSMPAAGRCLFELVDGPHIHV